MWKYHNQMHSSNNQYIDSLLAKKNIDTSKILQKSNLLGGGSFPMV